jgi:hypothetical protein
MKDILNYIGLGTLIVLIGVPSFIIVLVFGLIILPILALLKLSTVLSKSSKMEDFYNKFEENAFVVCVSPMVLLTAIIDIFAL